jgi:hypothetical protein
VLEKQMNLTVMLMAGGKSLRMGADKDSNFGSNMAWKCSTRSFAISWERR